ncbi:RNA polymerase sigma-70 factor, ECF subfamily [Desulfosporosinus sp. I2]|uniref:RNA polymerase sigma factor n=1 Tax=Desulfosporosinus sp. I2 TaxID=1617025 RepID=UPI0005EF2327|nr:sigma-70 family RNA polymerase sigma factor [Desulfosporosinus sp. I2]KJR49316.1 RNA polymerase sigma-70 factor, ECF subfamily [Desulfosporosinus sp. I2]
MLNNSNELDFFEILTKQNYEKVYKTVFLYTKDKWISEDAVQQAFVIGYNKLDQLSSKDKFASWVTSIALNEAKRMLKDKNDSKITPITDFHLKTLSDSKETDIEIKEDVDNILKQLKKQETEILVLKYYADLTLQQIADLLGNKLSNTKVKLHRARESFRNLVIQHQEQTPEGVKVQWPYLKKNLTD